MAWAGANGACGTTNVRSLALGTSTPCMRIRCSLGLGTLLSCRAGCDGAFTYQSDSRELVSCAHAIRPTLYGSGALMTFEVKHGAKPAPASRARRGLLVGAAGATLLALPR